MRESFNLWRPFLMIALCHQTKTPISFWYRRRLNLRSLIQSSEILPVELTGTYQFPTYLYYYFEFCVVTSLRKNPVFFSLWPKIWRIKKYEKAETPNSHRAIAMEDPVKEQTQIPLPSIQQQHPLSFFVFFGFLGTVVVVLYVCLRRHCRIGETEASTLPIAFRV